MSSICRGLAVPLWPALAWLALVWSRVVGWRPAWSRVADVLGAGGGRQVEQVRGGHLPCSPARIGGFAALVARWNLVGASVWSGSGQKVKTPIESVKETCLAGWQLKLGQIPNGSGWKVQDV